MFDNKNEGPYSAGGMEEKHCGYGGELAEAYIPMQKGIGRLYPPAEALMKGTVFPDLYRPYEGKRRHSHGQR